MILFETQLSEYFTESRLYLSAASAKQRRDIPYIVGLYHSVIREDNGPNKRGFKITTTGAAF